MADLNTITMVDRTIDIKHPGTGEPLGLTVSIMSIDDQRLTAVKRTITDERLRLQQRNKHFKAVDIEDNKNKLMFAAMTGWTWGNDPDGVPATFNGEQPDFNQRNVYAVFRAFEWIRDQIDDEIGATEDFFNNSGSN